MRAPLDLDFARSGIIDPRVAISRASGGTRRGPDGVWREVGVNTGRLHWADNLTALGLLMEPTRTNLIRNPRCAGASGATPPTQHAAPVLPSGTTAVYSSTASDGLPGYTVTASGTTNSGSTAYSLTFEAPNPAASAGQTYAASYFAQEISGVAGITNHEIRCVGVTAGGGFVEGQNVSWFTTRSLFLRRVNVFPLSNVNAAAVRNTYTSNIVANGQGLSGFSLFIAAPQLELGGYVTTPILAPVGAPAASTRATETLAATLARFGILGALSRATLLFSGRAAPGVEADGSAQRMLALTDGTANNQIIVERRAERTVRARVIVGGVEQAAVTTTATIADSADCIVALGASPGGMSLSLNGAAVLTGTPALFPAVDRLEAGGWGGTMARCAVWPVRQADAILQAISA